MNCGKFRENSKDNRQFLLDHFSADVDLLTRLQDDGVLSGVEDQLIQVICLKNNYNNHINLKFQLKAMQFDLYAYGGST